MNAFQQLASGKTYDAAYGDLSNSGLSSGNSNAMAANNAAMTFQNVQRTATNDMNALADAMQKQDKKVDSAQKSNDTDNSKALSDERCKELFGSSDILDAIAGIDAYRYRYKEGADKIDPHATPDKEHVGIMAQDLAANDVTKSTVEQDPFSGFLKVDTKELTMTTFALVTEIAKRLKALEDKINGL